MAYFGKFAILHSFIDATLLSMVQDVNIDYDSKAQQVDTIEGGFSGTSEGAEMVTVTFTFAVPITDFEINPSRFRNRPMQLTFVIAGRAKTVNGIGVKYGVSQGTGSASKATGTVWAKAGDFE